MTNKQIYTNFIEKHRDIYIPIFMQPFWLDNFSENWDVVLYQINGQIVAALPYSIKGNLLTKRIYLPYVNFYQSILFFESFDVKTATKIANQLFTQLPKTIKQYFKFLPEYLDIDLTKLKYKKSLYSSYILQENPDYSNHHLRKINKAKIENYQIIRQTYVKEAYNLIAQTFTRQKVKLKLTLSDFEHLNKIISKYNCGTLYTCLDKEHNILATALIVEDNRVAYYLFGAFNRQFKNSGAMHYLLNNIALNTHQQNKILNFCGSSKPSIAQFFKGFGAKPFDIPIWKKTIF